MGGIAIVLFAGLTALALISQRALRREPCDLIGWADCATDPQRSLMAQIAAATFGGRLDHVLRASRRRPPRVLLLAANTAFNGFPLLGSVLARDGYAPKSLATRGDRLVYSNGVIVLGARRRPCILIVYQANLTRAHPAVHHRRLRLVHARPDRHGAALAARAAARAASTDRGARSIRVALVDQRVRRRAHRARVLIVVTITKFTHGAWLVFVDRCRSCSS